MVYLLLQWYNVFLEIIFCKKRMNRCNKNNNDNSDIIEKVMRDLETITNAIPSIRICFIGDCGVGKSTIINKVMQQWDYNNNNSDNMNNNTNNKYKPTIGCDVQVLDIIHESFGRVFVEVCDMSGWFWLLLLYS